VIYVAVGAPFADFDGNDESGAVLLYYFDENVGWTKTAEFYGGKGHQRCGSSVDLNMEAEVLIAGCPGDATAEEESEKNEDSYVLVCILDNVSGWIEHDHIPGSSKSELGSSVSLAFANNNNLVLAASAGGAKEVLVFEPTSFAGEWRVQERISLRSYCPATQCKPQVDLSGDGDVVVIGLQSYNHRAGIALTYTSTSGLKTIAGGGTGTPARVGSSVALSQDGSVRLVGSPGADMSGNDFGSVLVKYSNGAGYTVVEGSTSREMFGRFVAVSSAGTTFITCLEATNVVQVYNFGIVVVQAT